MAPVHHRMPVVLAPEVWEEWLQPGPLGPRHLAELLAPAPDDLLEAYPVGAAVNNARNDGPELVDPVPLGPDGEHPSPLRLIDLGTGTAGAGR
jgi:putative SOS response-associated peptidase YedK